MGPNTHRLDDWLFPNYARPLLPVFSASFLSLIVSFPYDLEGDGACVVCVIADPNVLVVLSRQFQAR